MKQAEERLAFFKQEEKEAKAELKANDDMIIEHHPALGWGFAAWATCVHRAFRV